MKAKITVRSVEAILPGERDIILWDTEVPGFGCKVTPKGKRSYFLYYRTREGQQRRPAIGLHGAIKPEAARGIAKSWLADVVHGNDPSQTRALIKATPTFGELCDRYLTDHADVRKKASSAAADRRLIALHLRPALGSKKVVGVNRADMVALHHKLRDTPYEANRVLALASKMFALSERWGIRPDGTNPAKNIDRYKELKRERYLTGVEVARLWRALGSEEISGKVSQSAVAAIKLLMVTGRRLSEVLGLRWEWVDLDAKVLRLPDTKSGALLVSLADVAINILRELKNVAGDHPYVIRGAVAGKPLVNLQKPWRVVRDMAGIPDVRIHDLRHTFASVGAGMGMSLHMIGRLLGHTQAATTARYAHLAQDPVRVAADAIGAELMRLGSVEGAARQ